MWIKQRIIILLLLLLCSSPAFSWSLPFFHHDDNSVSKKQVGGEQITYQVYGLSTDASKNAVAWLKADQANIGHPLTPQDVQSIFNKSNPTILQSIQPFGFFKASIIRNSLKNTQKHEWVATYYVNPGQPLRITHLSVTLTGDGANQPYFQTYLHNLPIKQTQILQTETYNTVKKTFNNIATKNGFLAGRFTKSEIKIDLAKYTSSITLVYDTGPQYYFGQVFFKQNSLNDGFLQRFVQFKPGDPYSPDKLLTLQQNLSATPYFQSVNVEPATQDQTNLQVPINVTLTPSKSQRYNFGVGYGTDTGIRGTIGWTLPRVTKSGQYFNTNLQASQVQTNLEARYVIPGKNPITQQYYIAASITQESPNTSEGHTQKVSVGKSNIWYGWKTTLSLSQQFDQYNLRGGPWEHSNLLLPELNINKTVVDNPVFPSFGHSLTFKVRGTTEAIGSSTTFLQTELAGNYIFSPTKLSRLLLRGDLGITAVGDINTVPLSLQFFAGGSDSVRGYSYQELGPGKYLLVGSIEYQHQIIEKWYGAVFYDAGNAVNSLTNPAGSVVGPKQPNIILSDILKQSVGLGAVWVSPVGPMELTLAKPLSDPGKSVSLQFSMGTGL
jgi:translocation and assembly module TamA